MSQNDIFLEERKKRISSYRDNSSLVNLSNLWLESSMREKYVYNFDWMGRPIIQYPQDIVAFQEIVWSVKPDLIIETGIAHGGSLVLSASMLALLDMFDAITNNKTINPSESARKVLGIDIDIREHNLKALKSHPLSSRIEMFEGSSVDSSVISRVRDFSKNYKRVLVCLDSNHTYEHVQAELLAYASLVSMDSYCIVFDTFVENMPDDLFPDRPWGPGNNPKVAVSEFLQEHPEFIIDNSVEDKLLITVAPSGYLKRIV